jgi:hypothetical protein
MGSLSLPEERPAGTRPAPKKGGAPVLPILLLLGAGAAAGGYWFLTKDDGKSAGGDGKPPTVATPTPTPTPTPTSTSTSTTPEATPIATPTPTTPTPTPTPTTPAAPKGLTIPITSDPPGATVTIDGTVLPQPTPTELKDADEKKVYEVKIALKGFHEFKVAKYKPKANDKIDAALVPNEKHVEVSSTPTGADVFFDGKKVGKTPFTIKKLDVSKTHELEVKRVGFVPQTRTISSADAFESKGDKDVLAVALTLEAEPKKAPAPKPTAPKAPTPKATGGGEAKPEPAAGTPSEKPAGEEKKPEAAPSEKPAAEEKKAAPEEKPAEQEGMKVPTWTKKKPAADESGGGTAETPPPSPSN